MASLKSCLTDFRHPDGKGATAAEQKKFLALRTELGDAKSLQDNLDELNTDEQAIRTQLIAFRGSTEPGEPGLNIRTSVEVPGALFFSSSEEVADGYTFEREYGEIVGEQVGKTSKASLRMDNPMRVDFEGDVGDAGRITNLVEEAKAAGHDGIIIENVDDTVDGSGELATTYVLFTSEQVTLLPDDPIPMLLEQTADLTNPVNGRKVGLIYRPVPTKDIPKKPRIVYKLMKMQKSRPGVLLPLYAKPEEGPAQGYTSGTWYLAENQRPQIGGKKLAERPGIHSVALPVFDQGKAFVKEPTRRVWVEVEMPAIDTETQAESDTSTVLKNGMRSGITDR